MCYSLLRKSWILNHLLLNNFYLRSTSTFLPTYRRLLLLYYRTARALGCKISHLYWFLKLGRSFLDL